MATNMSDLIEQFILNIIGDQDTLQLSRNELATYFKVAPSQINYVLATRFNLDKGYVIESKRGGGGSITLVRINLAPEEIVPSMLKELDNIDQLTYNRAVDLIDRLVFDNVIEKNESELLKSAISDKALALPYASNIRKNIFKEVLVGLMKR